MRPVKGNRRKPRRTKKARLAWNPRVDQFSYDFSKAELKAAQDKGAGISADGTVLVYRKPVDNSAAEMRENLRKARGQFD